MRLPPGQQDTRRTGTPLLLVDSLAVVPAVSVSVFPYAHSNRIPISLSTSYQAFLYKGMRCAPCYTLPIAPGRRLHRYRSGACEQGAVSRTRPAVLPPPSLLVAGSGASGRRNSPVVRGALRRCSSVGRAPRPLPGVEVAGSNPAIGNGCRARKQKRRALCPGASICVARCQGFLDDCFFTKNPSLPVRSSSTF